MSMRIPDQPFHMEVPQTELLVFFRNLIVSPSFISKCSRTSLQRSPVFPISVLSWILSPEPPTMQPAKCIANGMASFTSADPACLSQQQDCSGWSESPRWLPCFLSLSKGQPGWYTKNTDHVTLAQSHTMAPNITQREGKVLTGPAKEMPWPDLVNPTHSWAPSALFWPPFYSPNNFWNFSLLLHVPGPSFHSSFTPGILAFLRFLIKCHFSCKTFHSHPLWILKLHTHVHTWAHRHLYFLSLISSKITKNPTKQKTKNKSLSTVLFHFVLLCILPTHIYTHIG